MNMLIVDDEYEILTWLEEMFRYDFDEELDVYTAASAYEALDLLNQVKFDVVMTDIKMPGMDGIALFERIKSNWPHCKTIFLTGYPNVKDMYQIINHKDVRYMLKSEDDETIIGTVKRVIGELREETEQAVLREKRQQDMERAHSLMRRELMSMLIQGEGVPGNLAERAREAGIPLDLKAPVLMFVVRVDINEEGGHGQYVLLERAGQIIRNNLPKSVVHQLFMADGQWGVGLVQSAPGEGQDMARLHAVVSGALEYAQGYFEKMCARTFSAATESTALDLAGLADMFLRMKRILSGGLARETGAIVRVEAVDVRGGQARGRAMAKIPLLRTHLELHRRAEYFSLLEEVSVELAACPSRQDAYGMGLYYSVAVLLLQFIEENGLSGQIASGAKTLTSLQAHASWGMAAQHLFDVSGEVFAILDRQAGDLSDRALARICDYIDAHLGRELSLTRLADIGGFNASYLSRLFKQKYDVTITEYVTKKRMMLAAQLLSTTNEKINAVAEKCGYLSSHSFARAFKGRWNMSPAEYREISRKGRQQNW